LKGKYDDERKGEKNVELGEMNSVQFVVATKNQSF
jgi:hypothetical protein